MYRYTKRNRLIHAFNIPFNPEKMVEARIGGVKGSLSIGRLQKKIGVFSYTRATSVSCGLVLVYQSGYFVILRWESKIESLVFWRYRCNLQPMNNVSMGLYGLKVSEP